MTAPSGDAGGREPPDDGLLHDPVHKDLERSRAARLPARPASAPAVEPREDGTPTEEDFALTEALIRSVHGVSTGADCSLSRVLAAAREAEQLRKEVEYASDDLAFLDKIRARLAAAEDALWGTILAYETACQRDTGGHPEDPRIVAARSCFDAAPTGGTEGAMNGIERIAAERQRQIEVEGWTAEHDDRHRDGSLARAAACYALPRDEVHVRRQLNSSRGMEDAGYVYDYSTAEPGQINWPWAAKWWKPNPDPVRNLEKAGALIAAEIDRILRLREEP